MKKYIITEEDYDIYSVNHKKRSPVLKVEGNKLFFNLNTFNLNGLSIENWLKENSKLLTHNVTSYSKGGSDEVYTYSENMLLHEVKLDDNEDYYISYKISEQAFKKDILQLNNLLKELDCLFHAVEPHESNKNTYGLAFRDLIIKSCTEVETHWKELMNLNNYKKSNLNTKDYCKLMEFINFGQELKLYNYPSYELITPFLNWNPEKPTKSLDWYNVYNELKHDRTNNLNKATLKAAIDSVSAVFILVAIRNHFDNSNLKNQSIEKVFTFNNKIKSSKWSFYGSPILSLKQNYIHYFNGFSKILVVF
jgi:hypothetical protein